MIIKKFQGKTEEEAILKAKTELGEGAVIMHVKKVKPKGLFSFFKKKIVEVSAGAEEESDGFTRVVEAINAVKAVIPPEDLEVSYKEKLEEKRKKEELVKKATTDMKVKEEVKKEPSKDDKSFDSTIEKKLDELNSKLEKQLEKAEEKEKEKEKNKKEEEEKKSEKSDFLELIYNTLLDNEVSEPYIKQIMEDAKKIYKPGASIDYMLANIYQKMVLKFGKNSLISEKKDGPKIVYFIGPTGVGKTTTIAKLASKLSISEKKKVVLLTTDTYRIAATEQLRTYAGILNVSFRVVYTIDEMKKAMTDFSSVDYILVDTAGHSHENDEMKKGIKEFMDALDKSYDKQVYLVVSATTKYRDLKSICDTYSSFTDYSLIFTKLDETSTLGNLYNLRLYTKADMSYVTYGQNVPDDIEVFSPQNVVKKLLGGK